VAVNFQHREAEAQAVCREIEGIGLRALTVKAGVSKAAEVARLVENVEKGSGGIDILANDAGIRRPLLWPVSGYGADRSRKKRRFPFVTPNG
jgi:3-oxoacyl-[acyl-carrier protein] reductase